MLEGLAIFSASVSNLASQQDYEIALSPGGLIHVKCSSLSWASVRG